MGRYTSYMENDSNKQTQIPPEEEKLAEAERALELEQLEAREYQGTYRNDQASN